MKVERVLIDSSHQLSRFETYFVLKLFTRFFKRNVAFGNKKGAIAAAGAKYESGKGSY